MKITVRVIGPEIYPKQDMTTDFASPVLKDIMRLLLDRNETPWSQILKKDFSLAQGYALLVNGRNMMTLDGLDTVLHEGDELVFMVMINGG